MPNMWPNCPVADLLGVDTFACKAVRCKIDITKVGASVCAELTKKREMRRTGY